MIAIYARTSTDNDRKVSIKNQTELGIKFANRHSLKYVVFIDKGQSGGKVNRTEYQKMMNSIKSKGITHLWFYDQSRSWRDRGQALDLWKQASDLGLKLCIGDRILDYDSEGDFIMYVFEAMAAERMRKEAGKRNKMALKVRIPQGGVHSRPAYGWRASQDKKLEQHPDEVDTVKLVFQLKNDGMSLLKIAQYLNERNIKGRDGGKWSTSSLSNMLKNKAHYGLYIVNVDGEEVKNYNPDIAIISKETFNKAQRQLEANLLIRSTNKWQDSFLKGVLKCNVCGKNMSHKYRGKPNHKERKYLRFSYYSCSGKNNGGTCSGKNIASRFIDDYVWKLFASDGLIQKLILKVSQSNEARDKVHKIDEDLIKIKSNLKSAERKKLDFLNSRWSSIYDEETAKYINEKDGLSLIKSASEEIEKLEKSIAILEVQREELHSLVTSTDNLKSDLAILTEGIPREEKRQYIRRYIKEIFVGFNQDTKRFILLFNFIHSRESFAVTFKRNYTDVQPLFNQEGELIGNKNVLKYLKRGRSMFVSPTLNIEITDYKPE